MSRVHLPRPYGATKKKRINPTAFNANAATTNMRTICALRGRRQTGYARTEVECLRQALANACADRGVSTTPHNSPMPMPTRMPSALPLEPDDDWLNTAMEALTADLEAAHSDSVWGGVAMVAESPDSVVYDFF